MKSFVLALALGLAIGLGLSSCTTYTFDQEMAISCRGYAATLKILTPHKPSMTVAQIGAVDAAVAVLGPACRAASGGGGATVALDAVRSALSRLLVVEKEVAP